MYQCIWFILEVVTEGLVVNICFGCSTEGGEVWNYKQVNSCLLLNAFRFQRNSMWYIPWAVTRAIADIFYFIIRFFSCQKLPEDFDSS